MPNHTPGAALRHGVTDRRVVGLRERLLRAGAHNAALSPEIAGDPAVFDAGVDQAVRSFQQRKGLMVDGVVGADTDSALNDAQYSLGDRPLSFSEDAPLHGDDVEELQNNLSLLGFYYGHLDGTFNRQTEYAVRELQRSLGVAEDGVVDLETLTGLARVSKEITTAKAFSLRDQHRLETLQEALRGREIILISSVGAPQEQPAGAPESFTETQARITQDVAARAYDLLLNLGAAPLLVGAADREEPASDGSVAEEGPTAAAGEPLGQRHSAPTYEAAMAAHPNAMAVFLQCDWNPSPQAQGVATFYWGDPLSGQSYAPIGHRASDMILRELVARTGAQDLGSHARQWSALRTSGTAAAWVDLGYLSNQTEASQLMDPRYRARLAESLLCGLQRMVAPVPENTATGAMSLEDIRAYYRGDH